MITVLGGFPKLKMGGHAVIVETEEKAIVARQEHPHVIVSPDMKVKAMELLQQGYTMYEQIGKAELGEPVTDVNLIQPDKDYMLLLPIAGG